MKKIQYLEKEVKHHFKISGVEYNKIALNNVIRHLDNCLHIEKFTHKELNYFELVISLCFEEHERFIKKDQTMGIQDK